MSNQDQVNACNQNTMKQRMREARILLTTRVCKSAFWKAIRKVYADKDARLFNWIDEMHDFWILLNLCPQTNCKNTCFAGLENLVCPTQANDTTSWAKSTTALESSSVEIPTSTNWMLPICPTYSLVNHSSPNAQYTSYFRMQETENSSTSEVLVES